MRLLAVAVCALLTGACSTEAPDPLGRVRQPVVGGVVSGPERDAVVLMMSFGPDRSTQCTATVIAPNLAVTARHCVSVFQEGTFSCTIEGNIDINRTRTPSNAGEMGPVYSPELIQFHVGRDPDWHTPTTFGKQVIAASTDTICRNDIAFVVLEDELDVPLARVRLDRPTYPGQSTLVVGYGINESRTTTRHERAGVDVLHVGPSAYFEREGNALPRTFVVGQSACSGDSGGPALAAGTDAVLGVSSMSRGDCHSPEVRNIFTQLAPFEALARQAFAAAGHEPLLEPEDGGGPGDGEGGQGPTDPGAEAGAASEPPASSARAPSSGCDFPARSASAGGAWAWLVGALLVGVLLLGRRRRTPTCE